MISFIDTTDLKNKFAELLSELYYSSKLTLEQISDSLTYDKRFLFLEKNKANDFMSTPNSVLIKDIFNAEMMFESDKNNPVYWAGLQYMTLSFNYLIPLNQ